MEFEVFVSALTIRDINKDKIEDRFYKHTNRSQNLDDMLVVIHRFWRNMKDGEYIWISDRPSIEQMNYAMPNILDGWVLTFNIQLEIPYECPPLE